jgi:hypothetical protein
MSVGQKNVGAFATAALLFVLGSVLLWLGRASVGSSTPLLVVIVGCYVAAIGLASPASMATARAECIQWYRAWQAAKQGGAP